MVGRQPKPTALKVLHGNPGKRPLPASEPKPPQGAAKPPSWLGKDARRIWRMVAPTLEQMGCLTTADTHAFALLCDAYAEYQAARKVIDDKGATYESVTEHGSIMIRQRPEVAIAADAWRRVERMMTGFGMTPSSRGRVQVPQKADEKSPFEEWLSGSSSRAS